MSLPGTEAITDQKLIDEAVAENVTDFETKLSNNYDESQIKQFRTIGAFIMQGMDIEEACVLSRIDPRMFASMASVDPAIRTFIAFKQVSYKAKLMRVVSSRAIDGMNEKLAGWILERRYRDEWGSKNPTEGSGAAEDAIAQGIEYIRLNGDTTPVVDHSKTVPTKSTVADESTQEVSHLV